MVDLELNVPDYFYEDETRCGFFVTKKRKQFWAVQLDLLFQLQKICEKYHLKYYALGGTLLGAVRHKGYIPWDDDIDIIMPRNDYDQFISLAQQELREPYFISYTLSEKSCFKRHITLHNCQTTGYKIGSKNCSNCKGISIDIMPMDVVPSTLEERIVHRKEIKKITKWADRKRSFQGRLGGDINLVLLMKYILSSVIVHTDNYDDIFYNFEKVLKKYNNMNTGYIGHASISYRERGIWPVSWYEKSELIDFEFMKINVPSEYMKILYQYFGKDCMEIPDLTNLPPSDHTEIIYDTDVSFTKYFNWSKR